MSGIILEDRGQFLAALDAAEYLIGQDDFGPMTADVISALVSASFFHPEWLEGATDGDYSVSDRYTAVTAEWANRSADGEAFEPSVFQGVLDFVALVVFLVIAWHVGEWLAGAL